MLAMHDLLSDLLQLLSRLVNSRSSSWVWLSQPYLRGTAVRGVGLK